QLLGPLKVTIQTAERRAVAGASETAGSLVFRPRERPPTQLHQAPSRLQGCAPSGLSTNSGAAEPKSLSRLFPNWLMPKQTCRLVREFRVGWVLESRPPAAGSSPRRSGRLREQIVAPMRRRMTARRQRTGCPVG